MYRLLAITLVLATASADVDNEGRFFFVQPNIKTLTQFVISSATTTVTSTPFCYTVAPIITLGTASTTLTTQVAAAGNCRRKRWAFENPIDEQLAALLEAAPMAASIMEASALPVDQSRERREVESDDFEFNLDGSFQESDPIARLVRQATDDAAERFLNPVIFSTATLTNVVTVTNTAGTKTLTIGCTPQSQTVIKTC